MIYTYTDSTNRIVTDGNCWSGLVTVPAVQEWIAEGNTIAPAPAAPTPSPLEQIRALEAQYADAQAKLTRQVILSQALDKAMTCPEAAGLTREQVHAGLMVINGGNTGYATLFTLEQNVTTLRALL